MRLKAALLRFWDFLVWVLVIFPLLTGGVWIRRPGFYVELSELGIPVLIVSALGALLAFLAKVDLSEASSLRAARRIWNDWVVELDRRPHFTLWSGAALMGTVFALSALRRHWAYGSGAADLGIFTNAIWNLTHGYGYISSVKDGMNLFADHQSPVFWVLAPLFRIFPFPETLLIVQSFGLSCGAVALYWIGRQYLSGDRAAALPLFYWAYLPLRNANSFDFHPEVLMLPFFLWAILGLQSEKTLSRVLGAISMIFALGSKESAGPVAVGISAAWAFGAAPLSARAFTRKLALELFIAGIAVFYVDTRIVPQSLGAGYAYDANYSQYGGGLANVLLAPIIHPGVFWPQVLGKARLKFLLWTLGGLSFLPLLGWRAAIAALPGYAILFLSSGDHRVNLQYHYAIEPSVGLFWALAPALLRISNFPSKKLPWAILVCALVFFGRSELFRIRSESPTAHHRWLDKELIPSLSDASFSVSGSMVPHIAARHWAHHLPILNMPDGKTVDCAIFDPLINNWPMTTDQWNSIEAFLDMNHFQVVYQCHGVKVFSNATAANPSRPYAIPNCLKSEPVCDQ